MAEASCKASPFLGFGQADCEELMGCEWLLSLRRIWTGKRHPCVLTLLDVLEASILKRCKQIVSPHIDIWVTDQERDLELWCGGQLDDNMATQGSAAVF